MVNGDVNVTIFNNNDYRGYSVYKGMYILSQLSSLNNLYIK